MVFPSTPGVPPGRGSWTVDLVVRGAGVVFVAVAGRDIAVLSHSPTLQAGIGPSATDIVMAAIGFVFGSFGMAGLWLGGSLFQRVTVSKQWRRSKPLDAMPSPHARAADDNRRSPDFSQGSRLSSVGYGNGAGVTAQCFPQAMSVEATMFDEIDQRYFERRARESREREQAAREPYIAQVHRHFAEEYERKAEAVLHIIHRR